MNSIFLIGLAVFFGIISGKLFQKLKIPQVVGYILLGLVLGKSLLHIFETPVVEALMPIVNFTLGLIGFIIGSELKQSVFQRYGKSIYAILLGEGVLAFVFVTVAVTLITHKLYLGLLFGAVAAATDPASTVSVLWENKAKGPLTTTLTSIVALDDGLAIILYGFAYTFAKALLVKEGFSFGHSIMGPLMEIGKCMGIGTVAGICVTKTIAKIREKDLAIAFILGAIALVVGLSLRWHLDVILSSMAFGAIMTNILPKKSESMFGSIREVSTALYILFFVVIGAQMDIHIFLQTSLILIIVGYLLARSSGKIIGAMLGGKFFGAKPQVVRYAGLGLFTQGGVAMGLSLSISHNIMLISPEAQDIATLIINVVAATTFVVQLIGPAFVKFSIEKCGEANRNVSREDIIHSLKVRDVMDTDFLPVSACAHLTDVIRAIKDEKVRRSPVVNQKGENVGSISLEDLKSALFDEELSQLIVAGDIAVPDQFMLSPDQPLGEAIQIFEERFIEYLPVIKDMDSKEIVGVLEHHTLSQEIHRRLLAIQSQAM